MTTSMGTQDDPQPIEAAGAEPAWTSPRVAWTVVVLLSAIYCLSFIDRTLLSLLIQPVKADLNLSDTELGVVTGLAFGLFYAVAGLPMGMLADRVSRRLLIGLGVFFWSAMTAFGGIAGNFGMLFVSRMGVGLGEAVLSPAAMSLIADYFPLRMRGRAISLYLVGASVGLGAAILVGGAVIGLTRDLDLFGLRGWQIAFLAVGLPGMLLAFLFVLVPEPVRRRSVAQSGDGAGLSRLWAFLRAQKRPLAFHMAAMSLGSAGIAGFSSWAPTFLIRTFGWQAEQVGYSYGPAVLVGSVCGMMGGGVMGDWLVSRGDRLGSLKVMMCGLFGAAIVTPLAIGAGNPALTIILFGFVQLFGAMPFAVSMTALVGVTPGELRGRVSAIYMFTTSAVGLSVGTTFVGFSNDHIFGGPDSVGSSISLLALLSFPVGGLCALLAIITYRRALASGVMSFHE